VAHFWPTEYETHPQLIKHYQRNTKTKYPTITEINDTKYKINIKAFKVTIH